MMRSNESQSGIPPRPRWLLLPSSGFSWLILSALELADEKEWT